MRLGLAVVFGLIMLSGCAGEASIGDGSTTGSTTVVTNDFVADGECTWTDTKGNARYLATFELGKIKFVEPLSGNSKGKKMSAREIRDTEERSIYMASGQDDIHLRFTVDDASGSGMLTKSSYSADAEVMLPLDVSKGQFGCK